MRSGGGQASDPAGKPSACGETQPGPTEAGGGARSTFSIPRVGHFVALDRPFNIYPGGRRSLNQNTVSVDFRF